MNRENKIEQRSGKIHQRPRISIYIHYPWSIKIAIYFLGALSFGFVAFTISFFHPVPLLASIMVGIAYSIAFGGAAILICEAGLAVVLKFDGQKKTITILQAFGVSFGIFVTGFFLLGGIQAGLKPYELPFLAYYYEADTPFSAFSILFFLKMLPVWVLDTILAIMALKLWDEYGKSLMRIRSKRHAQSQKICLFENKKKFVFEQTAITHISIQEHYASVYFKNQNQLEKKQIKMSLAKILECVGDESFIRIHRSHAVNVSHVTELTKISGVDQVKIENTNICLPVSRRNLPMVRKKLVYG